MTVSLRTYALGAPEPALSSIWIVKIPFNTQNIFIAAEQVSATVRKIPGESRFTGGRNKFYAGTSDIDSVSITFYETDDYAVSKWLYSWRKLVEDNGIYGLPADFKKIFYVFAYSKSQPKPTRTFKYDGVWPTDRNAYEYNQDETGRITVQAQFAVDDVEEI